MRFKIMSSACAGENKFQQKEKKTKFIVKTVCVQCLFQWIYCCQSICQLDWNMKHLYEADSATRSIQLAQLANLMRHKIITGSHVTFIMHFDLRARTVRSHVSIIRCLHFNFGLLVQFVSRSKNLFRGRCSCFVE